MGKTEDKKSKRLLEACELGLKRLHHWGLDQDKKDSDEEDLITRRRRLFVQLQTKLEELSH